MYVCEYVVTQYVDSVCVCMSSECRPVSQRQLSHGTIEMSHGMSH